MSISASTEGRRATWFVVVLLLVTLVSDGYSERPGPFVHQLFLLPLTALFLVAIFALLFERRPSSPQFGFWSTERAVALAVAFEAMSIALFAYEARHFSRFGYHLRDTGWVLFAVAVGALTVACLAFRRSSGRVLTWALGCYACGMALAISGFPLNYLRSDMLPVILWADTQLLHHVSPYVTMYVGSRVYDFPYLPGMLVAYFPAVAAHVDLRWLSLAYLAGVVALLYWAAKPGRRTEVAALVSLFVLCPFLQYRHEIYLEPHWFAMVAGFVLVLRRRFVSGAFVFGISMGIYQFSWIVFPFFVLYAFRRGGWKEAARTVVAGAVGMLLIVGPFLRVASRHIANNTVGQWGALGHALAEPINLSYWITYIVSPAHLLRLQAVLMVGIFAIAFFGGRCRTFVDTLRWSAAALTLFILTNSIVDGYFYLMLLVVLLVYVCAANGWLNEAPATANV